MTTLSRRPDDSKQITGEVVEYAAMLTEQQARALTAEVKQILGDAFEILHPAAEKLATIDHRQGWRVMGYASFNDYISGEKIPAALGVSSAYCYNLAAQGRALAQGAPASSVGALMEFAALNEHPEAQADAFDNARQGSPAGPITRSTAKKAVRRAKDKAQIKSHTVCETEPKPKSEQLDMPLDPTARAKRLLALLEVAIGQLPSKIRDRLPDSPEDRAALARFRRALHDA